MQSQVQKLLQQLFQDLLSEEARMVVRIRWLMVFRILIMTFILGISAFVRMRETVTVIDPGLSSIYLIAASTYLLSFFYFILLRTAHSLKVNAYLQASFDVLLIGALVFATGGIESIYSILYLLVIIYSILLMDRKGGFAVATACSVCYGLLLYLEQQDYIQSIFFGAPQDYALDSGYVFSRIAVHVGSFFIVAALTSFVVEQEKKLRLRLAERESAFKKLDQFHRSIIESVDTGILTVDREGRIKSMNRAAGDLTGYALTEVENLKIDEVFGGFSSVMEKLGSVGEKAPRKRFEVTVSQKSGHRIILGFSLSPLFDRERRIGDILIFQDLTAIKEMEAQAEKNKRLAFIGEMAAGLAHDLRNPLLSISGSIQMLKKDLRLDPTDERLMNVILRAKDQLENLIKNFLLFARTQGSERERLDVRLILDEVIEGLRDGSDWNGGIEVDRAYAETPAIFGNRTEIRQTFWNLMLNALQAMPDGGKLSVRTETKSGPDGEAFVEFGIGDTGCGMEPGRLEKVFEPFYTTKEGGTGLGLAIVSRIVESHGGTIEMESEPGRGSRCTVTFRPWREPESPVQEDSEAA